MIISPDKTPIPFLALRLWDRNDEEIDFFLWFNTTTKIASVPQKNDVAARVEIDRFVFVADSYGQAALLEKGLPSELHLFIAS